jgi:hypothetical protein
MRLQILALKLSSFSSENIPSNTSFFVLFSLKYIQIKIYTSNALSWQNKARPFVICLCLSVSLIVSRAFK